jgi:enoyl-CoA hydratase
MSDNGDDILKVETRDRVRILTLNRPDVRNALNDAMTDALGQAILDADYDPEVYLVAITGAGDKAFCSGGDLKEARDMADRGETFRGPIRSIRRSLLEVIIDSRKPSMAVVNGPAIAGGFELALACDLRVACDSAFFAVPEAKRSRGAHFASVALPQMVPPAIAMEWLLTGRRIELAEAERWGLVNRIAPFDKLWETAMELAGEVTSSAPLSLQRLKITFRKTQGLPLNAGIRLDAGPDVYASEDQEEGTRAFLERREPVWRGR